VASDFQTVSAEQLPPGDYILLISAMEEPNPSQSSKARTAAQSSFTVPADPPSGTVDLGEISLSQAVGPK